MPEYTPTTGDAIVDAIKRVLDLNLVPHEEWLPAAIAGRITPIIAAEVANPSEWSAAQIAALGLAAHDAEVIAHRPGVDAEAIERVLREHYLSEDGSFMDGDFVVTCLCGANSDSWDGADRHVAEQIVALRPGDVAPMPYIAPVDGAGEKSGIPQRPSVSAEVEWGVRKEDGSVWPARDEAQARDIIATLPEYLDRVLVRRTVTPWEEVRDAD